MSRSASAVLCRFGCSDCRTRTVLEKVLGAVRGAEICTTGGARGFCGEVVDRGDGAGEHRSPCWRAPATTGKGSSCLQSMGT